MKAKHILILGNHNRHALSNTLSSLGFIPEIKGSMLSCLEKLQHHDMAAIIVDRDFTHADILEFILNVRDINDNIFILILGRQKHDDIDKVLLEQHRLLFIEATADKQNLKTSLKEALEAAVHTGVGGHRNATG